MVPDYLREQAEAVLAAARAKNLKLATAESCTGGMVAAALTDIAGSSDVFDRGFVTYSNAAKRDILGVPEPLLIDHGAVSAPVARAMATGALERSDAHVSVAITGIAGPGGGTAEKPVGLVHFGAAHSDGQMLHERHEFGDIGRATVREKSVAVALELMQRLF